MRRWNKVRISRAGAALGEGGRWSTSVKSGSSLSEGSQQWWTSRAESVETTPHARWMLGICSFIRAAALGELGIHVFELKAWRALSEAAVGAAVSEGGRERKSCKSFSSPLNAVWDILINSIWVASETGFCKRWDLCSSFVFKRWLCEQISPQSACPDLHVATQREQISWTVGWVVPVVWGGTLANRLFFLQTTQSRLHL